jgi:hypothetical protein
VSPERRRASERGGGEDASPWAVLNTLLLRVLADHAAVAEVLSSALMHARVTVLPTSSDDLIAFVRASVVPVLGRLHGPRIATALLESLRKELDVPAPAAEALPPMRKRLPSIAGAPGRPIALVLGNPLDRSGLARALISAGFDVRDAIPNANESLRVAIIDLDEVEDDAIGALCEAQGEIPMILRSSSPKVAEEEIRSRGLSTALALPKNMQLRELVMRAAEHSLAAQPRTSFERISAEAMRRIPVMAITREDSGWFDADPAQAAVIALVDGRATIADIAERAGLSEEMIVRTVRSLVDAGVLELD